MFSPRSLDAFTLTPCSLQKTATQTDDDFLTFVATRTSGRFKRQCRADKHTVYLAPIGSFDNACVPDIVSVVSQFVSAALACTVRVLSPIELINPDATSRHIPWQDGRMMYPAIHAFCNGVVVPVTSASDSTASYVVLCACVSTRLSS